MGEREPGGGYPGRIWRGGVVLRLDGCPARGYTYAYDRDGIRMFSLGMEYRRARYEDYAAVLVSNAAYNNGPGDGIYTNIRKEYVSKGDRKVKTVFPYLTLHRTDCPIWRARAGLYSREVGSLAPEGTFFWASAGSSRWQNLWSARKYRCIFWRKSICGSAALLTR